MLLRLVVVTSLVLVSCSDGDDGDVEAFCASIGGQERFDPVFDDFDTLDPVRAAERFGVAHDTYVEIREVAPAEARRHLDTLVEVTGELRDRLEDADPDDPASGVQAVASVRDRFGDISLASAALTEYEQATCSRGGAPAPAG